MKWQFSRVVSARHMVGRVVGGSINRAALELERVREAFGLHLHRHGRRSYRSAIPRPQVPEPDPKLSVGDQDAGNLIIEGDNLPVMVSLRSQLADAIEGVYIDPPYNRGANDLRYSDARFQDPTAEATDAYYVAHGDDRHRRAALDSRARGSLRRRQECT